MKKVFMFLAQGFEDIEALIPLDVLRRGGVDVKTVSVGKDYMVTSAHGVDIKADFMFNEINREEADLLMLPGGMPGATNLYEHKELCQALLKHNEKGKMISAICAAPAVVLAQLGILDFRRATCYPGFEQMLTNATYTGDLVTVDKNITTAEGPAAAFPYAYELLEQLTDKATADKIAEGMRYKHLMNQ